MLMVGGKLNKINSRWILDSRGNPTVEVDVTLKSGSIGRASVPSGASTGSKEAHEIRDGGAAFGGQGVLRALKNIDEIIAPALIGKQSKNQSEIDQIITDLDGTKNMSKIGANANLAVSLAVAKAYSNFKQIGLYQHIANLAGNKQKQFSMPIPMANLINGGRHANFATDFQEYMIVPIGIKDYSEQLRACSEIYHQLRKNLQKENFATTVGDEGGFAPKIPGGNKSPLDYLVKAISGAGYKPGNEVSLALDVAASEFYKDGIYHLKSDDKLLSRDELLSYYQKLANEYPLISVEDGFFEADFEGWEKMMKSDLNRLNIVGDDLLVTNPILIRENIKHNRANALLVKPNQIGTLSKTIEAVKIAKDAGWKTIMSHRSGETEDTTIAHLAVGLHTDLIKTGSMSRSERLAKYNELLRINETLAE